MESDSSTVKGNPNKWLFVVKQHSLHHAQETGIACAVKKTVNKNKRVFVLTCKNTQNQREYIVAHCACQRRWSTLSKWFYGEHEPIDISNSREDEIFSFTPVENCCNKPLPLISEDKHAEKNFAEGVKVGCSSFINAGDYFRTVNWLYNKEKGEHYLKNAVLPKDHHSLLGSPVLWTDDHHRSFVVGVVGYSADRNLCPKFFTESALRITEVPMPVQLEELPPKVKENHVTLKWSKPQDQNEPIEQYTIYQGTANESGEFTELKKLTTIKNSSVCEYSADNLERGKKYKFLVTATNKYGEGMKGQGKQVKVSKDVPMTVKLCDISSDHRRNDFTLKWLEPKNNGADILDYRVYRRTINESGEEFNWDLVKTVPRALTECVITLERGKTFDLLVTAMNRRGESLKQEDNAKRVQVSEDVPMPVELINVPSIVNSNQITLKWRKPTDNGATITGYKVYQRTVGEDGAISNWQFVDSTKDCNYVITLERGRKLDLAVTAINRCGESLKKEENAKRVEFTGEKPLKYVYEEILRLLQRFVMPLADIIRRVQVLEENFANLVFGLLVLSLLGSLILWCLWASGFFGFGSVFLVFLGIVAVWHFWRTGDVDFQVIHGHMIEVHALVKRQLPCFVLSISEHVLPRARKLIKDNFAHVGSEFLDLFLMGIFAVCCHWIAGFFVNVGTGSLLLLLIGILAVWHFWRTDIFANVGFGLLVLFLLGSLAFWCLWTSGFIGFNALFLVLLGTVVVLHLWRTGDPANFQAVQSRARQLYEKIKRLLPSFVLSFSASILAGVQRLKYKFDKFTKVGFEFLIGIFGLCCLWASGFFINVGFLVLLYFGILAVWYLWRTGNFSRFGPLFWFLCVPSAWYIWHTEYLTNFGLGSFLVWLVLGISSVWYFFQGHVDSRKIKQ